MLIYNFFGINEMPLIITNIVTTLLCLMVIFYEVYAYRGRMEI